MQVVTISKPQDIHEAALLKSHHQLRARVFSDRLGWDVDVSDGCESDNFDALQPTYVLAIDIIGRGCGMRSPSPRARSRRCWWTSSRRFFPPDTSSLIRP